jgi:hypothetical protein
MYMIAKWVSGVVLHVTNQDVMPVGDIQGTIRGELQVYWPEVPVIRLYKILAMIAFITSAIVN